MDICAIDLALAPPNFGGEELALTPQFLPVQALRHRYLRQSPQRGMYRTGRSDDCATFDRAGGEVGARCDARRR